MKEHSPLYVIKASLQWPFELAFFAAVASAWVLGEATWIFLTEWGLPVWAKLCLMPIGWTILLHLTTIGLALVLDLPRLFGAHPRWTSRGIVSAVWILLWIAAAWFWRGPWLTLPLHAMGTGVFITFIYVLTKRFAKRHEALADQSVKHEEDPRGPQSPPSD